MKRKSLFVGVAFIWLIGFMVGVAAPTSILSENGTVNTYVQVISPVSDPKGLLASKSSYPQVTRLYYSVTVWSLPLWIAIFWGWLRGQVGVSKTGLMFKQPLTLVHRAGLLALAPLLLLLTYAATLNDGGDTRLVQFGTSRIQLAALGMSFQIAAAATIAFFVFCVWRAVVAYKGDKR